jgi:hypothetical protein
LEASPNFQHTTGKTQYFRAIQPNFAAAIPETQKWCGATTLTVSPRFPDEIRRVTSLSLRRNKRFVS